MRLRFLLFVLIAASVPLVIALMVTARTVHVTQAGFENRITGALTMLEARMEADGARRRELLLRLSDPRSLVGTALRDATARGAAPSADLAQRLRNAVQDQAPNAVPEFVAVATPHGAAISITDRDVRTLDVASTPLARSALDGHRAEIWALHEGDLYRFFSVPIGIAEGAFIIGDRVGNATAIRLREASRTDVSFVIGDTPRVSSIPILERDDVTLAVERPNSTVRTGRLSLGIVGFEFLDDVFPLFAPGEAMVSLARSVGNQVSVVVSMRTEAEAGWVGWVQLFCIALSAGTILFGLLWSWFLFTPVARQARSIERHLARLRVEKGAQLTTRGFSAPFITLVQTLDKLSEHLARETPRTAPAPASAPEFESSPEQTTTARHLLRPPQDLPLSSTPDTNDAARYEETPAAFPFGDDPALAQALAEASASLENDEDAAGPDAGTLEDSASGTGDFGSDVDDTIADGTSETTDRLGNTSAQGEFDDLEALARSLKSPSERSEPKQGWGDFTAAAFGTGTFGPEGDGGSDGSSGVSGDADDSSGGSRHEMDDELPAAVAYGGAASPAARFGNDGSAAFAPRAAFEEEPAAEAKVANATVTSALETTPVPPVQQTPPQAPPSFEYDSGPVPLPPPQATDPLIPREMTPVRSPFASTSGDGADALPPDLLARSRELEQEFLSEETDPDEEHYQEVYETFLETRAECGESASGLSLEKFSNRLRKNRDQLVEKYGCRTVRFQVYAKDGKAAIKASPVK